MNATAFFRYFGNMVMFYALVVIFSLSGSAVTQIVYPGKCPDVESQPDFDVNKFKGIWYHVERYVSTLEPASVCSIADFEPGENGTINVVHFYATSTKNITTYLTMTPHHDDPSLYRFKFPIAGASSDCRFLGSDYVSYTDLACCTNNGTKNVRYVYLMTRSPLPKKSTIEKAREVFAKNHVDMRPLVNINTKNCLPKSMNA